MPRTISFLGSVALLVSNITGPPLVVIPLLYQQAGWLTPLLMFVAMALLSGTAALFLVETMSSIEGNERFQAAIEFTTISYLILGKRWHIVVQVLLYLAMQSLVIASLLEAFQSMDEFFVSVAHKTCAVSFTGGWICVNSIPPNAPSAFSGYILGSFGTLISLCLILPLSLLRLVDNIIFQVASFILLLVITVLWIVIFAVRGLDIGSVPVVGQNQSTVVGFVLSNFSFVTTIPAWVNETHHSVNIRLAVWIAVITSCLIYIPIGWMGGSAFVFSNSVTLLQALVTGTGHGALNAVAQVSTYMFPLAVLITSIPVFTIVMRYNLLRGNICSKKWAIFWSAIVPWLIVIPLQTNGALTVILNWGSLIFTSPSNLLVPFVLFVASKRSLTSTPSNSNLNITQDPQMLVPAGPTSLEQTAHLTDNTSTMTQVGIDSIAGGHDNAKVGVTHPFGAPGQVPTSMTDGIPMHVMSPACPSNMDGCYERVVPDEPEGGRSTFFTGATAEPDRPELYLAFPSLSPTLPIRPTHISGVGFLLSAALVLTAIVYNIVQSVSGR